MKRATSLGCLLLVGLLMAAGCKKSGMEVGDRPALDGSSTEPVLMRYKFAAGDHYDWESVAAIEMDINAEGQSMEGGIEMEMSGDYNVTAVNPDGSGEVTLQIGHLKFDMSMGGVEMAYDSDNPGEGDAAMFATLADSLREPFAMTISTLGAVETADIEAMSDRFAAGAFGMGGANGMYDQLVNNTIVPLSEDPVGVGDVFGSGSISMPSAEGTVEISARYEVLSISGNGDQVLLKPILDLSAAFETVPGMTVERASSDGWLLFDVELGLIAQAALGMDIAFSARNEGEEASGEMVINITWDSTDFARGSGEAPLPDESPQFAQPPAQTEPAVEGTGTSTQPTVEGTGASAQPPVP